MNFILSPPPALSVQRASEFRLSLKRTEAGSNTADPQRPHLPGVPAIRTAAARAREESLLAWRDFELQLFLSANLAAIGGKESVPVTDRVVLAAYALLHRTNEGGFLVKGDLYPDGDGGLRVEWEQEERQVRLSIHPTDAREDYLYWQEGGSYNVETPLSPALLIGWLRWLQRAVK